MGKCVIKENVTTLKIYLFKSYSICILIHEYIVFESSLYFPLELFGYVIERTK